VNARILPGAEAFRFDGGPIGALLIHGFTGCPASLRPMGEWLAAHGLTVVGPRLPGHGTSVEDLSTVTWRDWEGEVEAALADLAARCTSVVVVGLSFGGALALHLAASLPNELRGVVLINPYVSDPRMLFSPVVRLFARTVKGVGNDIKKPGQDEICYDRIPVRTLASVSKMLRTSVADMPRMQLPLLVFSASEDHTVKPSNSRLVMDRAGTSRKDLVVLSNSYHVATLDYDAESIFQQTLEFTTSVAQDAPAPPA
jgi:carboxylesterase